MMPKRWVFLCLAACQVLGCTRPREVVVFHAASLRRVFADAAQRYREANPGVRLRLEPSGSQVAIRKVTEQGARADLVAVADAQLVEKMMVPRYAAWNLEFATNEVVLAYQQHSRFTEETDAGSWPEVLLRPGVRLGRVDPDTAPLGYHTLFVWQLAQRSGLFANAPPDL
ncbi:MAG: substrate-binding domain-containing protein, partial [Deltaproteobacteria bacterium]|nr:substrate-binding domain-containing protein [Deltaproteobacteria bacterium]